MKNIDIKQLDWEKMDGLLPAIVQDASTGSVLMLGYMNQDALTITAETKQLTFYSRSKQSLWRKGATSGNTMQVVAISSDCDGDSVLVQVIPAGRACHLGFTTCFQPTFVSSLDFLNQLIAVIASRQASHDPESYTVKLLMEGMNRCAQKLGEEAVETVIAAVSNNTEELITESADLLFHLLIVLQLSSVSFYEVLACLQARHQSLAVK